ncbi:MAG: MFS transporter [Eubacteriales bacterium]|nr:MFS transporter [Eubacteriales bacterium]
MKLSKNDENRVGFGKLTIWQTSAVSRTINVLIMGSLMLYCTDALKVPAAGVSLILLLSKFADGITDAVAGFIVDKTKTKWGTGRPYEVFIVGLWLCTWLLFSVPESFSTTVKYVWIFAMYVLANAVCTTFLNANSTPYMIRAFKEGQIIKLTSYGSIYSIVVAIAFNMIFPSMMQKVVNSPAGWSRLVGMFAVPLAAIGLLRMIFVKERYDVDTAASKSDGLKVKDVVTVLKSNPYIFLLALSTLVVNIMTNMGVGAYYFTYIVGNLGLMGVLSAATIICIPIPFLFPKLIQKMSVIRVVQLGFALAALSGIINFFAGSNMVLLMLGSVIGGMGTLPSSMLAALIILQCADYNEWKGNHRMEGTMGSVNGLAGKVGAALGTGALGIILQLVGYTGDIATMPQSALIAIRVLYGLVPAVFYAVTGLILMKYRKLDKLMPQIKEENQARRDAAAETPEQDA